MLIKKLPTVGFQKQLTSRGCAPIPLLNPSQSSMQFRKRPVNLFDNEEFLKNSNDGGLDRVHS